MGNKKVLILEDMAELCDIYKRFLETYERKYDVDCFNDIYSAKKAIDEKGVDYWDCFIVDLCVPSSSEEGLTKVNKFEGFDIIETHLIPCKTIVVSGYSSPDIKVKANKLGIVALYSKPIDLQLLLITLNSIADCN
jgi:DNA-binding NtrC family response regulator